MAGVDEHAGARRLSRAKAATPRKAGPRKAPARIRGVRWWVVLLVVAAVLIGLPLAHAFVGELGAVLLGVFLGGFALGRATGR